MDSPLQKRKAGAPKGNTNAKGRRTPPPPKWREEYIEQAKRFCLLKKDATDLDLAKLFGVTPLTIHNWRKQHSKFAEAIYEGKDLADGNVANALYKRAVGFEHEIKVIDPFDSDNKKEVVVKREYYPPDTGAAKLWLTNRSRHWKDKQTVEVEDPQGILAEMLGVKKEDLPK